MYNHRFSQLLLLLVCFSNLALVAQEPPPGWHFRGAGSGGVTEEGNLYVDVDHQQEETDWVGPALPLVPGGIYRMDFDLRVTPENADGNVTPGLVNYSVDTKRIGDWQHESLTLPAAMETDRMRMRLGAWKLGGRAEFKNWTLKPVIPIFHECGNGLCLGKGETIVGNTFTFSQAFPNDGLAQTRLLPRLDNIRFNTDRFCLETPGACVTYAMQVPGRQQLGNATLELFVNHHIAGTLMVEASQNGQDWTILDNLDTTGTIHAQLPTDFYPAEVIYFRFRLADGGSLQVNRVRYTATLDSSPLAEPAIGLTNFALVDHADARLAVQFHPLGALLPGAHTIVLELANQTDQPILLQPSAAIEPQDARAQSWQGDAFTLPPRQSTTMQVPCFLPDAGDWQIRLALGGDSEAAYVIEAKIPEFQSIGYGAILTEDATAVIWTAEAGWHVARERIPPTARDTALRIQAAANEAEAAQLVLRPNHDLDGVTLVASDLTGPDGANIPAAQIAILQEYYHEIQLPTDKYGYQGLVPDALPPAAAPLALAADRNQPFWIRVKVPAGTPAGTYRGTIAIQDAHGWSAVVPLEVEVFGFELPDRMTLETAFGFDLRNPFLYHQPDDDAQKRELLDLYLQALADHHLSPYNPAPLDGWSYAVQAPDRTVAWQGTGEMDRAVKFAGEASLKLVDNATDGNRLATTQRLAVPDAPLRFSFRYRTAVPDQACSMFVCFFDADGKWLSGRNQTFNFTGDGETWQEASGNVTSYPTEAQEFTINFTPLEWSTDGHTIGSAWFDDLRVLADQRLLVADDFEPARLEDYRIVFDWSRWDAAVERALAKFHFNTLNITPEALHAAVEVDGKPLARFAGFLEGTEEFTYLHRKYLHEIQEHLREKGWLDMSYVYWYDEPEEQDYPYVMNGFRKLREGAPDLRRMLTEQVEPALFGGPNLWCPVTYSTVLSTIAERQAEGEDFWWYVCTGPKMPYATLFMDHPATNLRVWLWQTWQHQVQGVLIWATTYWNCDHIYTDRPQNPYVDTMSWAAGYNWVKPGQRQPWGNGDGRFLYPPLATVNRADGDRRPILEPPVDSIRIEMLRDGIEDYEYCVILRKLRDDNATRFSPAELAHINALLTVPSQISEDMTHFTHSPEPILKRRSEIGRAITELLEK